MELKLSNARKDELRKKIVAVYVDEFDEEISDFKADRLLDTFCEKLAPSIYNAAVQDMKQFMMSQLEDLEAIYTKE